jgi:hypothetical protein
LYLTSPYPLPFLLFASPHRRLVNLPFIYNNSPLATVSKTPFIPCLRPIPPGPPPPNPFNSLTSTVDTKSVQCAAIVEEAGEEEEGEEEEATATYSTLEHLAQTSMLNSSTVHRIATDHLNITKTTDPKISLMSDSRDGSTLDLRRRKTAACRALSSGWSARRKGLSKRRPRLRAPILTLSESKRFVLVPSYDEAFIDTEIRLRLLLRLSPHIRPRALDFSARVQHFVWRRPNSCNCRGRHSSLDRKSCNTWLPARRLIYMPPMPTIAISAGSSYKIFHVN